MHRIAGPVAETDLFQHSRARIARVISRESLHMREMPYVLRGAEPRIERERLRHQPKHTSESAPVSHWRFPVYKDATMIGSKQRCEDRQRRRLACGQADVQTLLVAVYDPGRST